MVCRLLLIVMTGDGSKYTAIGREGHAVNLLARTLQGLMDHFGTGNVPQTNRPVVASSGEQSLVRGEGHGDDPVRVPEQRRPRPLPGDRVPELCGLGAMAGGGSKTRCTSAPGPSVDVVCLPAEICPRL